MAGLDAPAIHPHYEIHKNMSEQGGSLPSTREPTHMARCHAELSPYLSPFPVFSDTYCQYKGWTRGERAAVKYESRTLTKLD